MRATWIPVTERDPSPWQTIWATCHSLCDGRPDWVIEGVFDPLTKWNLSIMIERGRAVVTAWMPREYPEPYKETSDEIKRERVSKEKNAET